MAQRRAETRLEIALPPPTALAAEGPLVRGIGITSDARLADLLRNGFPARLHYRVELWSTGGWFDNLEGRHVWDMIVQYDPLDRRYRVAQIAGDHAMLIGEYDTLADTEAAVSRPYRVPLRPGDGRQRFYYNAVLEVETLSLSDLDEVERWLRGEFRPAVRGERNPGTALTRGLRTLLVRLLGGRKQQYQVRTGTFRPA